MYGTCQSNVSLIPRPDPGAWTRTEGTGAGTPPEGSSEAGVEGIAASADAAGASVAFLGADDALHRSSPPPGGLPSRRPGKRPGGLRCDGERLSTLPFLLERLHADVRQQPARPPRAPGPAPPLAPRRPSPRPGFPQSERRPQARDKSEGARPQRRRRRRRKRTRTHRRPSARPSSGTGEPRDATSLLDHQRDSCQPPPTLGQQLNSFPGVPKKGPSPSTSTRALRPRDEGRSQRGESERSGRVTH